MAARRMKRNGTRVALIIAAALVSTTAAQGRTFKSQRVSEAQAKLLESTPLGETVRIEKQRIEVSDGDTILIDGVRVRIQDCDAPETGDSKCDVERERGERAANRLRELFGSGDIDVRRTRKGLDRYRRPLMHVFVNRYD